MQSSTFEDVLNRITKQDLRYHREAYLFVREALDHTQSSLSKAKRSEAQHITGKELLEGVRVYALSQFGPMSRTVLAEWGIHRCEDVGEIVFNMVDHGLLSKTEQDSRQDFQGAYDFDEAFCKPFRPKNSKAETPLPRPVKADPK